MFARRHPLPIHRRIREFAWPNRGWHRASLYIAHRVRRLPGTPYRIAAGFACGAAISFTPFIGFHFVVAALLAVILRGSVVASLIGTAVGNPWTFAVIWPSIYKLGRWILGESPVVAQSQEPDFISLFTGLIRALLEFDLAYIIDHVSPVLWPMTVGGIPIALIVWFAFFWPVRGAVAEYQHARYRRRRRKLRSARHERSDRTRTATLAENESEGS
jgi:uncharacterized protein (DUF2062 family)